MDEGFINKNFSHFKIHSQYSICEGALKIDDLSKYCKENKIKSIGLCDSYNLCGALEFAEKLSKIGTQPIIGTQINFLFENIIGKLPLFATTETGYKNLTKLSSKSYLESDAKSNPHCKITELENINKDLIILTGTINDFFGSLFKLNKLKQIENILSKLNTIFKDNIYIEVQRHGEQEEKNFENYLISISKSKNIPLIASQEVFYLKKDMFEAHDALVCIGEKNFVDENNRKKYTNQHYLKNNDELNQLFKDLPEALENNYYFPYRFCFKPKNSAPVLPSLKIENNLTLDKELENQAKKGLLNRLENFIYKKDTNKNKKDLIKLYEDRLIHELKIINSMNYAGYFLIVSDYIKWSKKNNIPVGPGRGSGAGSLVAYCLDITDLDPLEFDLIFERFLNPDRISMPDFDIDFCEEKTDLAKVNIIDDPSFNMSRFFSKTSEKMNNSKTLVRSVNFKTA